MVNAMFEELSITVKDDTQCYRYLCRTNQEH